MIYTEFDPLQEVIVGDTYSPGDLDHLLPNKSLSLFNKILEETKEDIDSLARFLSTSGIKVHRPKIYNYKKSFEFPNFEISLPISPMVPRDQYKVQGKTILQTYTSMPDRYFDGFSFYHIFQKLFDEGYNWVSQPSPMLKDLSKTDSWYTDTNLYHSRLSDSLLWHTATMFSAGKDIIINRKGPGTNRGYHWIKRNLPEFTLIENKGAFADNFGHIDHGFILIDDETIIHAGINWIPKCLRNKRLIDISPFIPKLHLTNYMKDKEGTSGSGKYDIKWLDKYLTQWSGYNQEVSFDLNVLIIDSHNIVFGKENFELFKFLKKYGITAHCVPQRHSLYWDSGIHCATLDLKRKGEIRKIIQ